jgi:hypothetical protein
VKRYEGSEIIGYREPEFDEFLLPLGPPTEVSTPKYAKILKIEGVVSFYTYLAPAGRTGKDSLGPHSQPTLQEIAKLLTGNPKLKVQVVGHTDNQGTPDYNLDLSRRRAASVVRALTSNFGVAASRLSSFGCGPSSPVASNDSEDGKAKNRRVELVKW